MQAGMVEPGAAPAAGQVASAPAPRRRLVIVAGIVVALAAIITVIVLAATRGPAAYPAGSPEAAFQAYLIAWEQGDAETAYLAFSREVRSDTTLAEYRTMASQYGNATAARVVLEEVRVEGDRATLELRIEYPGGGLFGGGTWSEDRTVTLVREDGAWRIDQPVIGVDPQPWWKY